MISAKSAPGQLESQFLVFHRQYPMVYHVLVARAREWKRAGHSRCGIKMLFEVARWSLLLQKQADGFKLNNNHHAFYARLIERQEPDLQGFFQFRQQRVQSTLGPDNRLLESGEHRA